MKLSTAIQRIHDADPEDVKKYRAMADAEPNVAAAMDAFYVRKCELDQKENVSDEETLKLYRQLSTAELLRDKYVAEYLYEDQKRKKIMELIESMNFEKDWYYLIGEDENEDWACYLTSPVKAYVREGSKLLDGTGWEIWTNGYPCEWW